MRNVWRLSIVGLVGMALFGLAITKLNSPPFSACTSIPSRDRSFDAELLEEPNVNLTRYRIRVTQDGQPVDGANVCMRADMGGAGGMSGMGLNEMAGEVEPGVYEVPVRFMMGGFWQSTIVVELDTGRQVGIPLNIIVSTTA